jgi:hypothetical protein
MPPRSLLAQARRAVRPLALADVPKEQRIQTLVSTSVVERSVARRPLRVCRTSLADCRPDRFLEEQIPVLMIDAGTGTSSCQHGERRHVSRHGCRVHRNLRVWRNLVKIPDVITIGASQLPLPRLEKAGGT